MKRNGKKGSKLALRLACVLLLAALLCGMGLPAGAEEEPAATEPESEVWTEPSDNAGSARLMSLTPSLFAASQDEPVTVSVEGANISTKAIPLGDFAENAGGLAIEGYDFVSAWYGSINITGLYKAEAGDFYYGTVDGNTLTGVKIEKSSDVVLKYETHTDTYSVTYNVTVNGEVAAEPEKVISIVGASTVKSGNAYQFVAAPADGYTVGKVSATSGTVTNDGTTYTVGGVTANTTITIPLTEEKTTYNIVFSGSNTTFKLKNWSQNSQYDNGAVQFSQKYTRGNQLAFQLVGHYQWNGNPKVLNKLTITIDGTAYAAEIPDALGESESKTTTIAKGYQVTVTKTSGGDKPEYSVVITNPSGDGMVRGDIAVDTNYKDVSSSEVWAKQLDGVEPLAYKKGGRNGDYVTKDNNGDQNSRLQPGVFVFYDRTNSKSSESVYFVKLKDGYSEKDLYLRVVNYDVSTGKYTDIISEEQVSKLEKVSGSTYGNSVVKDYDYYFIIPADNGENEYTDIRIYIVYKPQTYNTYKVAYDLNDGSGEITDTNSYEVGDTILISETLPSREGYVFDGWYLAGDENTVYQPGNLFAISDNVNLATNGTFTFKAKWTDAALATYAPYKVEIYFENKDTGSFPENADITKTEWGNINSSAYIIPEKLASTLNEHDSSWADEYEYDHQETTEVINADGSTVLKVYYRLKRFDVTITKLVTGNMGDRDKSFEFTYQINGANGETFNLKHGESKTIRVRIGQSLTVTENSDGYEVFINGDKAENKAITVTPKGDTTITFTNTKNVNIDTGVSLDTLPYVLLLGGMAVLGGALLLRRREDRA